ncbi:MAG TPA: GNAT family N-acetyltransferase [Marmoricola sp.]|nr:GNAT family N-acetyltransferase [Marmoricola sp.]
MESAPANFSIQRRRLDHPESLTLIERVQAEYVVRYGGPDESPIDPSQFEEPDGAFYVAYADETPVGMGGWRWHSVPADVDAASAVEVKRMYVIPEQRGRGYARAMLGHLEITARDAGSGAIILETGLRQPEAMALYESCGYVSIRGFGFYAEAELSRCYAKVLHA